jgi:hypothetical protein
MVSGWGFFQRGEIMKCKILVVQNLKSGSPWPVLECGGAYVSNGDKIVVVESIAARMKLQHGPYLADGGDCERDSLAGGHYAIEKGGAAEQPKPAPKSEPKSEPVVADVETPAEMADDKSMTGRPKRRRKKSDGE